METGKHGLLRIYNYTSAAASVLTTQHLKSYGWLHHKCSSKI